MQPRTIWCLGRNYAKHAEELGNTVEAKPLVFQKGLNALVPMQRIQPLFPGHGEVHYETEIIALMDRDDGGSFIAAIGLGLDLTLRDLQNELKAAGKPWTLAKSFDGAAIVSRFISVNEIPSLNQIRFTMLLNGEVRQQGDSSQMILPFEKIPAYLEEYTDLQPGDIIFTGTPEGVGVLKSGDEVSLDLAGHHMGTIRFN
ncbi:MAG: fumarylacetoacetate hydrolase family protein [Candidatus Marinimicrobia bacterium]|nr:fumarylacetoacetate hydrolase family protein [Candidatus Neomarinimicrobiota bacterium]MBT4713944.1 fumarylacetoacetate hydrolase family protein [Candidatus Neomarinimicrobiota bacterium]MBT4946457.1 fumarylacetoacetate hydrolase family protein [Candidatus Neomarinimicrobiota bacterium]MBT5269551.1 fumarylacetoacetate hydrolase family protein [Candidatus Neomarinimicrobiota bacterium]MBT6010596.1 fumarylacetoacetate hydrolase family protein [Candidatus Neomarinimicrobiota bacterium]